MVNFTIYKNGRINEYDKNIKSFIAEQKNILFIFHGLYGRGKNWQSYAKKITQNEDFIVFTVDLRNHGGNVFIENMSYTLMMEDIFQLFKYLGIKKTNLLGHSMGGKLAMLISLSSPKFVNKVIIADIAPINYVNDDQHIINSLLKLNLSLIKNRSQADELLSSYIEQNFLRSFLLQNLKLVCGKYTWSINLIEIKKAINNLRSFPEIKNNNKIDIKTLCIFGENSDYVNENHFKIFKNYFSNIIFHKIQNAGHFLHIENPDEFYDISKDFLKD